MILEEETYEKFGYYSSDLKPHSEKKIIAACDDCGKKRELRKNDYHPLCKSCVQKGRNSPSWKGGKVKRVCEECGKEFEVSQSIIERGWGIFCSRTCQGAWQSKTRKGKNSSRWEGGKEKRICQICGKIFLAFPSRVREGYGRYCSHSCAIKSYRHQAKPVKTRPERIFEALCKEYHLPFKYTGDGSFWIGRANPDFTHTTRKLVVEVNGDYWHSPLLNKNVQYSATVEGRRKQLKEYGYKLIVLWESDLLREDVEHFVLSRLEKYTRGTPKGDE